MASSAWIDISVPLHNGMVHWPGDPEFRAELVQSLDQGAASNVTKIASSVHVGTHMDAPRHFIRGGAGMEAVPLDAVIGPCRVIEIKHPEAVTLEELRPSGVRRGERLLFKTRNSERAWTRAEFKKDFVYIAREAAAHLAAHGVRTVGVDYLSVGGFFQDGAETHEALLGAGVWIIEGLNLAQVAPGRYQLVCLPLKLEGSDGAPARAVVRPL